MIEAFRSKTFKKSICLPLASDAINNVAAIEILIQHLIYCINIIL